MEENKCFIPEILLSRPVGASQDWLDDVLQFTVVDDKDKAGVANLKTDVRWRVTPIPENPIAGEKALLSK